MDIDLLWKVSRFYNWLFVAFIVALPVFLLCAVAMATSGHDKLVALFGILCIMCIPAGLITASRYEHLRDNVLLAPDVRRLSEEYVQCRRRMAEIEALVYDTATGKRERELKKQRKKLESELERLGQSTGEQKNDQTIQLDTK